MLFAKIVKEPFILWKVILVACPSLFAALASLICPPNGYFRGVEVFKNVFR